MSTDPWRTPVILSSAQCNERVEVVTPLDLAERAARSALEAAPGASGRVDNLHVVGILFGGGPTPASDLAHRLGLKAKKATTTTIGGNTPQWLVNRAADDIAGGRAGTVLIAGGEAVRSQRLGATQPTSPGDPDAVEGDPRPGLSDIEMAAGLAVPAQVYPMIESVLAHRSGRSPSAQRLALGKMMAPFTTVAAGHPQAWFTEHLNPEVIADPSPDNRIFAEPYTKRMNAFMSVDQGAALVVSSLGQARELGLEHRVVFIWSGADAYDAWFLSQRADLGASPGIQAASGAALGAAGIGVDDLAHFDLYSCFPSAVQLGAAAVGLRLDDRRGLTVTGGLPYFGGPGNNYTTHAIATLADRLRGAPNYTLGLISGLGWYVTKHSIGIYGSSPPPAGYRRGDTAPAQAAIDAEAIPVAAGLGESRGQEAVVEASTVIYDRAGAVSAAPVIARLKDGRRVAAKASVAELVGLAGRSLVGHTLWMQGRPPTYQVIDEAPTELVS